MKYIFMTIGLLFSMNTLASGTTAQTQNFVFTVPNSKLMTAPVITNAKNLAQYECMTEATRLASQILIQMTFLELNSKTTPFQLRTLKVKESQFGELESYLFKLEPNGSAAVHLKYSAGMACLLLSISNR